jgi:hypothetical protein
LDKTRVESFPRARAVRSKGLKMEPEAFQVLVALRSVNQALLEGIKACVYILEKEEELTPERRKSLINSLKGMIEQGEKAFESIPTEH